MSIDAATSKAIIYPNPSANFFNLWLANEEEQSIEIVVYDLSGRTAEHISSTANSPDLSFGKDLQTGIYFVKVLLDGELTNVFRVQKVME